MSAPVSRPSRRMSTTLQAAGKILTKLITFQGVDQNDIEEAVARIGVGSEMEAWPDMLNVHRFQQDVFTGKVPPIEADPERLGGEARQSLAHPFEGGRQLFFAALLAAEGNIFARV